MRTVTTPDKSPYGGSKLLLAFIDLHSLSIREAARLLGVSKTSVIFWIRGTQRPEGDSRRAIAKWTSGSVPAASWMLAGESEPVASVKPYRPRHPRAA